MTAETILVIDAGEDVDQRMAAALEAESYLVYPVSSGDVNAEMAELLKPSLIYIKPLELSPTGLESCKAIHSIPLLKRVPIVILTSLKKALAPDYFTDYGIVDFLEPTFGPEELVEKTEKILGKTLPLRDLEEDEPVTSLKADRKMGKKRSSFLLPAIGLVVLLLIVGGSFLAYQQFRPTRKASPPTPAKGFFQAPSTSSKAGLKPQLPPGKNVEEAPAPGPTMPTTPSGALSKSQLPPARTDEKPSVPASSVAPAPAKPSGQSSSLVSKSTSPRLPKPFYAVQLGAFKNEGTAQALTKKFRERGYDAFTQPGVTKDKSPIFRVLVGRYEERKAAQKLAGEIQSRESVETALYGE